MELLYDITEDRYLAQAKSLKLWLENATFQVYIDSPNPVPMMNEIIFIQIEGQIKRNPVLNQIFSDQGIQNNIIKMKVCNVEITDPNNKCFSLLLSPVLKKRILTEKKKTHYEKI